MGYIRGNSTDQQRLWREGTRAPKLAYQSEYPTQGYESLTLANCEVGDTAVSLTQVNDYANKKRIYSVHRKVGESEAYWVFDKRIEADTHYENIVREASK
jgi:hypothetical protein